MRNYITSVVAGSDSILKNAFRHPVKIVNDAAMQALGSYKGGKMLFLVLGKGLCSALVLKGIVEPMELGHLPYKKGVFEDYVGERCLEKHGREKWRGYVANVVACLIAALDPDDVGARRWQRQRIEADASPLPGGRQRRCIPRRISAAGKRA